MSDTWLIVAVLAIATFSIRLCGVFFGQKLPVTGPWARALNALPGCLIISLVCVLVLSGGPNEWLAGLAALCVTLITRNLPLTMLTGILCVFALRQW